MKLIDAYKLMECLERYINPYPDNGFLSGISTAISEIEEAPTVDAVPVGWISVDDREPTYMQVVLVYCDNGYIGSDFMFSDGSWGHNWNPSETVTHWMPLPKPPGANMENIEGDGEKI